MVPRGSIFQTSVFETTSEGCAQVENETSKQRRNADRIIAGNPTGGSLPFRYTSRRDLYSGFGCAASASRNVARFALSMMAVPVSTQAGIGGAGALCQSLNSCTALW